MVDTDETMRAKEKIQEFSQRHAHAKNHPQQGHMPAFLKNIDPPMLFIIMIFLLIAAIIVVAATYLVCSFIYTIIHA